MPTDQPPEKLDGADETLPMTVERLAESYRFDGEMARLLTQLQYQADGITLTAAENRPLPDRAIDAPTPGLATVFESDASLVFITYDERSHRMVNPIETTLIGALAGAVRTDDSEATVPDGGTVGSYKEEQTNRATTEDPGPLEFGVVTPHNAQRGALETALPASVTANTVEKYQGGERDVMAVSATVSDPEFARREEQFLLDPRRLLVAISRARLQTIIACSTALFEVAPIDSDRLDDGPVWAGLFTQAVGRQAEPAWRGSLGEFTQQPAAAHATVPVAVYPSTVGSHDTQ